jgi:MFS family permease
MSASRSTTSGWATLAPALRSRNFRLFWIAQIVSTVGTSLQVTAEGYLVYQLTESTFWLGMVNFIGLLPVIPLAFVGGVLIDRFPRRKVIIITQIGLMLQAAVFGLLILSGRIQLWHIIVLYFVFGSLLAIDHPARRAFLVELVPQSELANAVALNATIFNISSLVGYAFAGFVIAAIGPGGAMLVNAATYTAPMLALTAIRIVDRRYETAVQPMKQALSAGLRTLWQQPALLGVISVMAVVGGLAWPIFGLMPAYAEEIMGVGAVGLGILLAAGALGSVLGTAVAARFGVRRRGRTLTACGFLLPFLVVGVAFSQSMWMAIPFLVAAGLVLLVLQSLAITLVQVHIPDNVRGRVMTIYSMLHAGADTGGNVIVGSLATVVGLPVALTIGAGLALGYSAIVWLFMPVVRRLE